MTEAQGTGPHDTVGEDAAVEDAAGGGAAVEDTAGGGAALADLRAAAAALEALDRTDDPGAHADRFEAVHDALVAVLADVDRT